MKLSFRPKGITFDVYSALFDTKGSLVPFVRGVLALSNERSSEFYSVWRETQLRYAQLDTLLQKGHTNFDTLTRMSLLYTCRRFGMRIGNTRQEELLAAWRRLRPFPDVRPVLREVISRKYKVALLSNGDKETLSSLARRIGTEFDDIFSAEEAGVYKPHPLIYRLPERRWRAPPGELIHVAGSSVDVLGSKAAGLYTVWVNRYSQQSEEFSQKPDYEIRDMMHLLELL
jgi:2-haloacid dehalogenase